MDLYLAYVLYVHETEQLCLEWRDLENAKDKCAEVSVKSLNPSFVLCLLTTH